MRNQKMKDMRRTMNVFGIRECLIGSATDEYASCLLDSTHRRKARGPSGLVRGRDAADQKVDIGLLRAAKVLLHALIDD